MTERFHGAINQDILDKANRGVYIPTPSEKLTSARPIEGQGTMKMSTKDRYDLHHSDGSTASYYKLPEGATELQHLISYKNFNAQIGEIFRACYRYGQCSHSDKLREAKKMKFYAEAEIERLEKYESYGRG